MVADVTKAKKDRRSCTGALPGRQSQAGAACQLGPGQLHDRRASGTLSPLAKHRPRREWLTAMYSNRFTFCFDGSLSTVLSVCMRRSGVPVLRRRVRGAVRENRYSPNGSQISTTRNASPSDCACMAGGLAWPVLVAASTGTCRCSCCSFEHHGDDCTPVYLGANGIKHCSEDCTATFCAFRFPHACPTGPASSGSAGLGGRASATCDGFKDAIMRLESASPAELKAIVPVALLVVLCVCSWCCLCRWCCLSRSRRSEDFWAQSYSPAYSTAYTAMPVGQPVVTAYPSYPVSAGMCGMGRADGFLCGMAVSSMRSGLAG